MSTSLTPSTFGPDEKIVLNRQGVWLSNGIEITHAGTCLAFARNLYRLKDRIEIHIGNDQKEIEVEDTFYFVQSIEGSPNLGYQLTLNDRRIVKLNPASLSYRNERLTCVVPHPSQNTFEDAKFLSQAYYEILRHLEKTPRGYCLTIESNTYYLSKDEH